LTEEIDHNEDSSTDESGLIKALRLQLKDQEKELKARPAREDLESEIRAQLKRESDAAALLIEQGHPSGLARFMLSEIGDAEITGETVSGFLKGLGFDAEPVSSDEGEQPAPSQDLAEVASLASRVSSAASGVSIDQVSERIANADSVAEITRIMEEIGAAQS
jgi:hypothetical protein